MPGDAATQATVASVPPNARFATWITGHRKTVIIGWIVALIGVGMIAGAAGSDFSEEFKLPASDSQEAFDLLENKFPAQSGDTRADRLQGRRRGRIAGGQEEDGRRLRRSRKVPPRQRSRQPLREGRRRPRSATTAKSPTRRSSSTPPATSSTKTKTEKIIAIAQDARGRRPPGRARRPADRGSRAEEEGDSSFAIGLLAAMVILLLTFGSVVAMGLPLITALFALGVGLSLVTLGTHVFDTADFAPQLAAMIGLGVGIDYALFILTRFRNGLDEGWSRARRRSPRSTPPAAPSSSPGSP